MVRSLQRLALMSVLLLGIVSCESNHTSIVVDTPPIDWSEGVELTFDNSDTLSRVDVDVVMYYDADAPDSASLVVMTTAPDGYRAQDTLMCYLPKSHKKDYSERQIPYRRGTTLRCRGTYRMKFTPLDTLDGVWAVGFNTITAN